MKPSIYDDTKYENPFKSTNADSMSYEKIVSSWSMPFFMRRKLLSEDFYLRTPMSLVISGARGSGKTMMFKYYSYQAQVILAKKNGESILTWFSRCKSISMYLKFDPFILQAFTDDDIGNVAFTHFFELVVCESYVEFLELIKDEIGEEKYHKILNSIYSILGVDEIESSLDKCVEDKINEVYNYISERKISGRQFDLQKVYHFRNLSYKIKEVLCANISELSDVIFLLVIDEGENFLEFEQKTLNGFIKTLNSRMNRDIFLRIGTREPEIKTYETINNKEFLTIGRDYELKDINYYTIKPEERDDYKKWLLQIAKNRLSDTVVFRAKDLDDIRGFLGEKENQFVEAKKWASNKKEHFKWCLKSQYTDELYESLRVEGNPLLEMMNILWYKKGHSIEDIKIGVNGYLKVSTTSQREKEIVDKYKENFQSNKVAFLYLLASKYKKQKQYYSFNTYSYLSVGNVCNFIKLCREAFEIAYFEDKESLFEGKISMKAQHEAAISVAYDEIEKVKYIPKLGKELYALVINIGNLFNEYHSDVDMKIIEANQFSVVGDDTRVTELINTALTWGVFLKKTMLQTLDNTGNKGTVYTLNKMFCPLFGISYRSKGRYKEVFDKRLFLVLTEIQKRKVSNVISSNYVKEMIEQQIPGQISLFGEEE